MGRKFRDCLTHLGPRAAAKAVVGPAPEFHQFGIPAQIVEPSVQKVHRGDQDRHSDHWVGEFSNVIAPGGPC